MHDIRASGQLGTDVDEAQPTPKNHPALTVPQEKYLKYFLYVLKRTAVQLK